MPEPLTDHNVALLWRRLGVPGAVDIHTHFLPPRMERKVWEWFDAQRGPDGTALWPIGYRGTIEDRVAALRRVGVRAWTALAYAHRPGMAAWLNDWTLALAARVPECLPSATFYPEKGVADYVETAVAAGARVFKIHCEVGGFDPAHRLLHPVWRRLEALGTPVVIHAGGAPLAGPWTGPRHLARVLQVAPDLVAVIAHMGMPDFAQFWDLALSHPRVHLDTTMVFTDFFATRYAYPPALLDGLAVHPDRVVLGSDFPTIPHEWAHQVEALRRLELGDGWLRAVCHDNGARLLGLD